MRVFPHVTLITHTPNPEKVVAAASRLCYSGTNIDALMERTQATDQRAFLEKLLSMNHFSPFEHVTFTFAIEGVSRALLAQITRHRIASFSVQSQRYVNVSAPHAKHYDDRFDAFQLESDARFEYIVPETIAALGEEAVARYRQQMLMMDEWYRGWLDALGEEKKEDARFVLPNACSTRLLVTMNTRELLHFFSLRCCNRAQWEIRSVAWAMLRRARETAPTLFASAGPDCVRGTCAQGQMSCGKPYRREGKQDAPED